MELNKVADKIKKVHDSASIVFISRGNNKGDGCVTVYPAHKVDELNLEDRMNELVGIYDRSVEQEWIKEDYEATIKNLNGGKDERVS